jgi:transposase
MSGVSACPIVLSASTRHRLTRLTRTATAQHRQVVRATIVLLAARGLPNSAIAARAGVCVDTARTWRARFAVLGEAGLRDRDRPGRPRRFTDVQQAEVKAIACALPADRGVPLSRFSHADVAAEAVDVGVVEDISASTVRRWLHHDAIRPWRYRSWIFPRDPGFAVKAGTVLDLYARAWHGEALGPDDYVISADEKTSVQARCRCHPSLPPGLARMMRVNHEYDRGGALAYLAAYDVHRARVFGRCEPTTGIVPFSRLVSQVMTQEPYARARNVFWVVDNGSSHRGQKAIDRLAQAWPNATLVHTPIHASWVNQVEIYFSIVQRKVVTPNDFYDLNDVEARLTAFEDLYNFAARPFNWRYTRTDLDMTLKRLAAHEPATI